MEKSGFLTSKLNNGRTILMLPNYVTKECFYRYISGEHIDLSKQDLYDYKKWKTAKITTEIDPRKPFSVNYIDVDGDRIGWTYSEKESKATDEYLKMHHLGRFVH